MCVSLVTAFAPLPVCRRVHVLKGRTLLTYYTTGKSPVSAVCVLKSCAACVACLSRVCLVCTQVDDSVVRAVGEGCKQLTHLSMNRCLAVTDTGIAALAASRPGLLSLKCNMCDKVRENIFTHECS